ncbi:hypothetical protein PX699_01405 [Sphingobium sp. H39-3-25]|uniref:hypothetical protein n=1 Tax=Sphingobium arseniciresistens TaxID=3030834 RepID=UPI0023B9D5ED|nr:hypothetical protein [Sphingobium arseniciresistens]
MTVTMLDSLPLQPTTSRHAAAGATARKGAPDFRAMVEGAVQEGGAAALKDEAQAGDREEAQDVSVDADPVVAMDSAGIAPAMPAPPLMPVPMTAAPQAVAEPASGAASGSASGHVAQVAQTAPVQSAGSRHMQRAATPTAAPFIPAVADTAPAAPVSAISVSAAPVSTAPFPTRSVLAVLVPVDAGAAAMTATVAYGANPTPLPVDIVGANVAQPLGLGRTAPAAIPSAVTSDGQKAPSDGSAMAEATSLIDLAAQAEKAGTGAKAPAMIAEVSLVGPEATAQAEMTSPRIKAPAAMAEAPTQVRPAGQAEEAGTRAEVPALMAEATSLLGLVAQADTTSTQAKASGVIANAANIGKVGKMPVDGKDVVMPAPKAHDGDKAPTADAPSPVDPASLLATPVMTSVASVDPGAAVTVSAAPSVTSAAPDIGASLGQSVVDLAVGNQWLDGVARDIANVVAADGQGSFRISPNHLGTMQVDIRNGALGVEADLTVKTEAARAALAADNDLSRGDGQQAVRIADIRLADSRVDRMNHVADTARSDTSGQNPSGQGGWSQGHGQSALAQNIGQGGTGSGAGMGSGTGGGAQNTPKVSRDPAVLGSGDSQDRRDDRSGPDSRGARYA